MPAPYPSCALGCMSCPSKGLGCAACPAMLLGCPIETEQRLGLAPGSLGMLAGLSGEGYAGRVNDPMCDPVAGLSGEGRRGWATLGGEGARGWSVLGGEGRRGWSTLGAIDPAAIEKAVAGQLAADERLIAELSDIEPAAFGPPINAQALAEMAGGVADDLTLQQTGGFVPGQRAAFDVNKDNLRAAVGTLAGFTALIDSAVFPRLQRTMNKWQIVLGGYIGGIPDTVYSYNSGGDPSFNPAEAPRYKEAVEALGSIWAGVAASILRQAGQGVPAAIATRADPSQREAFYRAGNVVWAEKNDPASWCAKWSSPFNDPARYVTDCTAFARYLRYLKWAGLGLVGLAAWKGYRFVAR